MVHLIFRIIQLRLLTVCVQVLGLIFGWEKDGTWTSIIMKIVDEVVNLILGF